jgi:hypothetical protein
MLQVATVVPVVALIGQNKSREETLGNVTSIGKSVMAVVVVL